MDPFEVRMQFLTLLRRLNASVNTFLKISDRLWIIRSSSQQSIQKVVGYALKYFSRCGEDLWDCIVEECQKVVISRFPPWTGSLLLLFQGVDQQSYKYIILPGFLMRELSFGQVPSKCFGRWTRDKYLLLCGLCSSRPPDDCWMCRARGKAGSTKSYEHQTSVWPLCFFHALGSDIFAFIDTGKLAK